MGCHPKLPGRLRTDKPVGPEGRRLFARELTDVSEESLLLNGGSAGCDRAVRLELAGCVSVGDACSGPFVLSEGSASHDRSALLRQRAGEAAGLACGSPLC